MSPAQAMVCGLPVSVSTGVGIGHSVNRSTAGLIVERNLESAVRAIQPLIGQHNALREMGENGHRVARSAYWRLASPLLSVSRA